MKHKLLSLVLLLALSLTAWAQTDDFNALLKKAQKGDTLAQIDVGLMYHNGQGVRQDYAEAFKWFRKAAEQGYAVGQNNLGVMYRDGLGVAKDYAKAIKWFLKAAEQGFASSQYNLGCLYNEGKGVQKDYDQAVYWYRKAAEQGHSGGQGNLGFMYDHGYGVTQDYSQALYWYQKSAEQGDSYGQYALGCMYEQGLGVEQDYKQALYWYSKSAQQGYFYGQKNYQKLFDLYYKESDNKQTVTAQQTTSQPQPQPVPTPVVTKSVDEDIPTTNAKNENTFVIIIANEDYKNVAKVPFALNDGRILAKYCQQTLGIPASHIKLHENATYNDIRLALAWLKNVCDKYEGEASVIFYYTGHGIPDESDKSAYLLPVDGDGRYVATGYKMDDLYQRLGEMPTRSITVLLDACFSGATRDGKMVAQAKGVALKVKKGQPKGNTVVLSAAQGDETAGFDEEEGHGMFTYYLLKKLQDTQGNVTLQELSQYIIREVGRKSAVSSKPQTPCVTPSASLGTSWQTWTLK